jgi:long-chain-fatty-acid--CoA ligase ACSBG
MNFFEIFIDRKLLRGQIVGIYATNSPEACHFILESSRSNIVVVDDSEQLEKILKVKDRLPHLKAVVKILPSTNENVSKIDGFYSWDDLERMNTEDVEAEYKRRLSSVKPMDCCSLCYTSGTTGMRRFFVLITCFFLIFTRISSFIITSMIYKCSLTLQVLRRVQF